MFIGHRKKEIVDSFLNKPRIQMIHEKLQESLKQYCSQHDNHRTLDIHPSCESTTAYRKSTFIVSFKYDSEDAELALAHELLHCKFVLDGAKLPIPLQSDESPSVWLVRELLIRSITHHTLIVTEQERYGYSPELQKFSLPSSVLCQYPDPKSLEQDNHYEKAFLLALIGKRLFVRDENADSLLRPRVCEKGLEKLYDRICGVFPDGVDPIEHVNTLTQEVIQAFGMDKDIKLVDLEDFAIWYEGYLELFRA